MTSYLKGFYKPFLSNVPHLPSQQYLLYMWTSESLQFPASVKGWPSLCRVNTHNIAPLDPPFTYAESSDATSFVNTPGSESPILLKPPATGAQRRKMTHDFPGHGNVCFPEIPFFYKGPRSIQTIKIEKPSFLVFKG